jgi:hypothetical protein
MAVVGIAANPSGAHQAGRHRAGQTRGEAEGACGWAERPLRMEMCAGKLRHGTRAALVRFTTQVIPDLLSVCLAIRQPFNAAALPT